MIYTPLERDQKKSVLDIVINDLLTPVGLRSLSPDHPRYQGVMAGYVREQKEALHQGTAYPWLLSFFVITSYSIHYTKLYDPLTVLLPKLISQPSCFLQVFY